MTMGGETKWVENRTFIQPSNNGGPNRYETFLLDITSRKVAHEALHESEKRYTQLVQHAPAAIFEIDFENMEFLTVNDVALEYTGYTRDEFLTQNPFDILTPESQVLFSERLEKIAAGENVPGPRCSSGSWTIRREGN